MIEQHVTSEDLSRRLKEAGVVQESEFYWCQSPREIVLKNKEESILGVRKICSAYLTGEIGERYPYHWHSYKYKTTSGNLEWCCSSSDVGILAIQTANNEAEVRGKMWLYLLNNNSQGKEE